MSWVQKLESVNDSEGWTHHPLDLALPPDKYRIKRWNTLDGQFSNHCDKHFWYALAPGVVREFHKRLIEVMELPPQAFSCIEVGQALSDHVGIRHRDDSDSGQLVMIVTLQGRRDVSIWRGREKSVLTCTRGHIYVFAASELDHRVMYGGGSLTLALRSPGIEASTAKYPQCPAYLN